MKFTNSVGKIFEIKIYVCYKGEIKLQFVKIYCWKLILKYLRKLNRRWIKKIKPTTIITLLSVPLEMTSKHLLRCQMIRIM